MSKVKEMIKPMITEDQLKTVKEQQTKLSEALRSIGILEVQKQNLEGKGQFVALSKDFTWTHITCL